MEVRAHPCPAYSYTKLTRVRIVCSLPIRCYSSPDIGHPPPQGTSSDVRFETACSSLAPYATRGVEASGGRSCGARFAREFPPRERLLYAPGCLWASVPPLPRPHRGPP